ncbi:MAG: hypothetical protein JO159_02855 [Acidobacteria bacterium]|nr:hypothetical protein [Acidobacteriota bacterium]
MSGNRRLIARVPAREPKLFGGTIPHFEHALRSEPFFDGFYAPEKETVGQAINQWIRRSGEFDGVA